MRVVSSDWSLNETGLSGRSGISRRGGVWVSVSLGLSRGGSLKRLASHRVPDYILLHIHASMMHSFKI